jgi:hypothetical protein
VGQGDFSDYPEKCPTEAFIMLQRGYHLRWDTKIVSDLVFEIWWDTKTLIG